MKIVQRYVLKEFLVPLAYCLTGFVAIYVLFELFGSMSRMIEAHLDFKTSFLYFCGYLAPYFHYLAPAALMLATLYTMWTMCRHSELIAMRASGISFFAIVKPLLMVSIVLALFVLFVNEWFVPRYANWAAQMKTVKFRKENIEQLDNIVYRNAPDNRTWKIDRFGDVDGKQLLSVRVAVERPGGARLMTISADRADYLDGEWWFTNVHVQHHDAVGQEIATSTPVADNLTLRCFPELNETPRDFLIQNRPWKYNSVIDRLRYLETHQDITDDRRNDLAYDTWAQIMAPWACVIITLFAIPAGIASGRQSVFRGIVGALGMFFGFYGVTIVCMIFAKNCWVPPILAAAFPLVLFFVLGVKSFIKQR